MKKNGFIQIFVLLLLLLGIAASVYLVQQQTNIFSKAAILKPAGPETSFSLLGQDECSGLLCLLRLQKDIQVEEEFKVEVFVRSDIDEANLFKAKILFPRELIEVKNINTDSSFIQNWVEQTYDNNEGTISLVGGVPDPGFKTVRGQEAVLMATVTFKTKDLGKGTLSFTDDSIIYRNTDNLNILTVKRNMDLTIDKKSFPSSLPPGTARGPQASITCPSGSVAINPGQSIQSIVNANGEGTSFCLKAGIHRQQSVVPKNRNAFIGEFSAVMDGESGSHYAFSGTASGIVIRNLEIKNYQSPDQMGAIKGGGSGVDKSTFDWVIENSDIHDNSGGAIRTGHRMNILRNKIHSNGQIGITGMGDDIQVEDNEIAYNNTRNVSIVWEAGGTKFVETNRLKVRNNWVHHNNGPGLWTDINNDQTLYEGNLVEDNNSS